MIPEVITKLIESSQIPDELLTDIIRIVIYLHLKGENSALILKKYIVEIEEKKITDYVHILKVTKGEGKRLRINLPFDTMLKYGEDVKIFKVK